MSHSGHTVLARRLKQVSIWLHGYSYFNNLICNSEFDVYSLIEKACQFHCRGIEINIGYTCVGTKPVIELHADHLAVLKERIDYHSLDIGIDISGTDVSILNRAIEVSQALRARFIRCYVNATGNVRETIQNTIGDLKQVCTKLGAEDRLLIENHEFLRGAELSEILCEVGDRLGVVYDYGNSVPAGETPLQTLGILKDRIMCAHVKDQVVVQSEQGPLVVGTALGEGSLDLKAITENLLMETKATVLSLQNVAGYSSPFLRDCDQKSDVMNSGSISENDAPLIIDHPRLWTDDQYRNRILEFERMKADNLVGDFNVVLESMK